MRVLLAAMAALALGACTDVTVGDAAPEGEAYTVEIRASEAEQTFVVHAPDGRVVGGRASDGASALMDASAVQALAAVAPPAEPAEEVMSLRLPGFSMRVGGENGGEGGDGSVSIAVGGGDGHSIQVNAEDGGPGEGDDRAFIRLTGLDADAVRQVIAEAETLSPSVQAQMLAELGLDQ